MIFKQGVPVGTYEIEKKQGEEVIYFNYMNASYVPSIAESPGIMASVIDSLTENPNVSRVVFVQQRNYNYPAEQVLILSEIARIYLFLTRQENVLSPEKLSVFGNIPQIYDQINFFLSLLRQDPIRCYFELKKTVKEGRAQVEDTPGMSKTGFANYIRFLERISLLIENTRLIKQVLGLNENYSLQTREIYKRIFRYDILPNFSFTRLMAKLPDNAELIDQYSIEDDVESIAVTILKRPNDGKYFYHIMPSEYSLSEEHHMLMSLARNVLIEHRPKAEEFTDPEKTRQVFLNVSRDLISELANSKGIMLNYRELNKLAHILVRHTLGFGLIEVLLKDNKLQDVVLNAPIAQNPIFVRHEKYDECTTNIIPSYEDADSWAAKLRLQSWRPLDEANPVLDTDLVFGNVRARVAAIKEPLSPDGLAYAIRRHRDDPWTLPLFIKNKMINSFAAGVLSFLVDGSRTLLVAGTRSSGKTSLLGSLLLEIMPKYRIIVIEDTLEMPIDSLRKVGYDVLRMKVRSALTEGTTEVEASEGIRTSLRLGDSALIVGEVRSSIRGDEEVVIVENGMTKRVPISSLEDADISKIFVPTLDFNLKTKLSKLKGFVKHPPRNKLIKIKTRTGREITVTSDHSLFTVTKDFRIAPVECKDLRVGSQIVIPSVMPIGFNDFDKLNLLDETSEFRVTNFEEPVRKAISKIGWKKATELCNINSGDIYNYFRTNQKTNMPISSFKKLMSASGIPYSAEQLLIKTGTSKSIPAVLSISEDLCSFLGYYLSEGYYFNEFGKGGMIVLTNSDEKVLKHMTFLSQKLFNITPIRRQVFGAAPSTQLRISCKPLVNFIAKAGCGRICTEKRIPDFVYGLSKNKISAFLRTLYEGDGSMSVSRKSGNAIRYTTTSKKLAEDVVYLLLGFGIVAKIYSRLPQKGNRVWTIEFKERRMVQTFMDEIGFVFKGKQLLVRKWGHSKTNTVYFDKEILQGNLTKCPRKYRHLFRFLKCNKNYLMQVVNDPLCEVSERLKLFANGDFYLDEIKEIEEINLNKEEFVYDLSVEPTQNFIGGFGGILLHNTEAKALYEAMRIGALANVVAGTIHGDSPYGVFDRVVNDLNVPPTSFKATDIIIITNPVKTPDGLHSLKRITQVTEVRKHWQKDPLEEKGFVDLLRYNVEKDELEPTQELINGDSEIIKNIASNVKGWAGNWDAVYDNILLRGKIKQEIVEMAEKLNKPKLLESEFNSISNNAFHQVSERVIREYGLPLSEKVFPEWKRWALEESRKY